MITSIIGGAIFFVMLMLAFYLLADIAKSVLGSPYASKTNPPRKAD